MFSVPEYALWDVDYRRNSERANCCFEEVIKHPMESIEKYMTCSICYGLPRSFAVNHYCGHILCNPCCTTLFKRNHNTVCPVCRSETTWKMYNTYDELDIIHRRLYLEFTEVKCGNGCGFTGQVPRVVKQEREECGKRLILCSFKDCPFVGPADFLNNEHIDQCEHERKVCQFCLAPQLVRGSHICLNESILERKRMIYFNVHF